MSITSYIPVSAMQASLLQEMGQMKAVADAPVVNAPRIDEAAASSTPGTSFNQVLDAALRHVDSFQQAAEQKQTAIDMGKSDDLAGAMIASQQASLSFSALVQVRNKIASGFNDLMSMSV